jgi:hypothetical protein
MPFAVYASDFRSVEQLALDHGRPTGQLPIFVWRKVPMTADITNSTGCVAVDEQHWALPWVVWDCAGPGMGVGVYSWRRFKRGDIIGVYTGNVLSQAQLAALPDDSRTDAITTIGGHLVDGKHPPRTDYDGLLNLNLNLLNGAERKGSRTINVQVTDPIGVLQAMCEISDVYDPRSVATAEEAERAASNRRSQLFWWYGETYGKPSSSTAARERSTQRQAPGCLSPPRRSKCRKGCIGNPDLSGGTVFCGLPPGVVV